MIGLVLLLIAQAPADAETDQAAFSLIEKLHAAAEPEPDPPPGLRADPGTERHASALKKYTEALRAWERADAQRGDQIVRLTGEFLSRFPVSAHRARVYFRLGCAHLERGAFGLARRALENALQNGEEEARSRLVEACRGLGDYMAALKHGGSDPELLEEAGQVGDAIKAALKSGRTDLAAAWRQIGKKPKFEVEIPEGCRALVIEAGTRLDPLLKRHLRARFWKRGLRFQLGPKKMGSIFLTDGKACISAVSPREDTWKFRISRLLGAE